MSQVREKTMRLKPTLGMGWMCATLLQAAAAAAPPPVESFFKDPDIVEVTLSPSGRKMAMTNTSKDFSRHGLAVVDLAPGGLAARIVQIRDADIQNIHWVNDDKLLFESVHVWDGTGRSDWGARGMYTVNSDGSKMRQVLDGFLLKVPDRMENDEILLGQYSLGAIHLHWLNTRSGATRDVDLKPPPNAVEWLTDSSGDARAVLTQRRDEDTYSVFWRAPKAANWAKLFEGSSLDAPFSINTVDDAGNLYVTEAHGEDRTLALKRFDFERHAPSPKPLVVTPGFDFSGSLLIEPGSAEPLGVRTVVEGETTVWFNAAMKAFQEEVDGQLRNRINRITCRRCGAPDMVALVNSFTDHDPGQLWLYLGKPGEGEKHWRAIGRVRQAIVPEQMASMGLHRIKARDGRDLPVWVTRPDDAKGPLPAVVLVHGGPWERGRAWGWHDFPQFLASRGYVVIEPEFRGSRGYGEAHFKAGWKQWGQAMQDDVADALLWARKQNLASDKACIAGASYGGYSTLMGLVKDPELYRCGIAWVAVTDLDLLLQGSWWITDDATGIARKYTLPEMIGDAKLDAAMIAANSPVKQAARIKVPVLLAFGEDDHRVPLAHGKRMRDALKEAGNPPEWVTYPGEGHGFAVVKNRVDFAQRMEKFLAKHLLGQP
jgi:dipeptidyl aminopeptidase/acylaminoacyl peptidase